MAVLDNLIAQAQNGADLQQLLRIFKQSENTLHHQGSQAGGAALLQASLALDLAHHSLACLHILCAILPCDAPLASLQTCYVMPVDDAAHRPVPSDPPAGRHAVRLSETRTTLTGSPTFSAQPAQPRSGYRRTNVRLRS